MNASQLLAALVLYAHGFFGAPRVLAEAVVEASASTQVPVELLAAVCARESRFGLDRRAQGRSCGVWRPVMEAVCSRNEGMCNGSLSHDQAFTASVILRTGLHRCGGSWAHAAAYFYSGTCGGPSSRIPHLGHQHPLDYGERTVSVARGIRAFVR